MLGGQSVIAVLASLLILHSRGGSGEVLDQHCGQSSQRVAPWTALLHVNKRVVCAGTLIHSRFVLTAAHCIRDGENLQVRLGEYGRDGELPENFEVDVAFRNRRYNVTTLENDIGLLRLSWPVQYKDHITPICIYLGPPKHSFVDSITEFTGNAWTRGKDVYLSKDFHSTYIQRVADTECRLIRRSDQERTQICAMNRDESSCDGPAGSALSRAVNDRIFQFGIASYNELDCQSTRVYTDVVSFSCWIQRILLLYGRPSDLPATAQAVYPTTPMPRTTPPPTTTAANPMRSQLARKQSHFQQWDYPNSELRGY